MILLANCHVAALKASEIQYARDGVSDKDRPFNWGQIRPMQVTDQVHYTPFSSKERDWIQIQIRPSRVALCKDRLGLGDPQSRPGEAHSGRWQQRSILVMLNSRARCSRISKHGACVTNTMQAHLSGKGKKKRM